jgi:hypothetical protein
MQEPDLSTILLEGGDGPKNHKPSPHEPAHPELARNGQTRWPNLTRLRRLAAI